MTALLLAGAGFAGFLITWVTSMRVVHPRHPEGARGPVEAAVAGTPDREWVVTVPVPATLDRDLEDPAATGPRRS